ncbi:phage recombination protein Bet [Photobacterium leiognathi]|uniref:phage recombination protein Bet n=1 Tax=Photobacterium leiognathi TaxID=553611 RepID=UPI0029826F08|nr:phage recombination protein Bet [Photobacterium leiognathi]
MSQTITAPAAASKKSLVGKIAEKFGVDQKKFWDTLKATAFKQRNGNAPTNEQMMSLLIVADQYGLNPFTKEIYAFPDQQNGIIPVVGVDGWSRIINSNPQFDGMEFRYSDKMITLPCAKEAPEWCECVIYRRDRSRPTIIREYLDEVYREPMGKGKFNGPWQSHTKRFLRHKTTIQAARLAFGFVGIYDQDEADRIIDAQASTVSNQPAITFDSSPVVTPAIAESKPSELQQDLAQADFSGFDETEVVTVQSEQPGTVDDDGVDTSLESYGSVSEKDAKMIMQMVGFAKSSDAWDTTKDSFNERYQGETLEFALDKLNAAFNETFTE